MWNREGKEYGANGMEASGATDVLTFALKILVFAAMG
jgi:hypothetical protein